MQEYILINRVPSDYGQEQAKEVLEAWKNLTDGWKKDQLFLTSFVFPKDGNAIVGNSLNATTGNVLSDGLKIVSVIIIKASDLESAIALAKSSPILQQNGAVEIREIMTRPSA